MRDSLGGSAGGALRGLRPPARGRDGAAGRGFDGASPSTARYPVSADVSGDRSGLGAESPLEVSLRFLLLNEVRGEKIGSHANGYCYLIAALSIRTYYPSAKVCEVRFF